LSVVPTIQIKNVPDDVHAVLRRRADEAGQSLQAYLLAQLTEQTGKPTVNELLERVRSRSSGRGTLAEVAAIVRADRDSR